MKTPCKTTWTREDEGRFQELAAVREEITVKNSLPVMDLVLDMLAGPPKTEGQFVAFLKLNADRFRDVLEPFDSGVRPAEEIVSVLRVMPSVAPKKTEFVDRSELMAAVSRLKDIYSPHFCRFVVKELSGREKVVDVDPEYFDIIIRCCDAYVEYHSFYPNITGATFPIDVVQEGSEYRGIHTEQMPGSPAKNFGDL